MLLRNKPGFVHPKEDKDEMFVDIGAYGPPKLACFQAEQTTRKIEEYVRSVNGYIMDIYFCDNFKSDTFQMAISKNSSLKNTEYLSEIFKPYN